MSAADRLAEIRAGWAHNEPTENEVVMADALDAVLALCDREQDHRSRSMWSPVAVTEAVRATITDALGDTA